MTYFHPLWNGASIPANTWHFHRRLWERYKTTLGPGEYSKLMTQVVKNGEGLFYAGDRARVHKICLAGRSQPFYVIADDKALISVLLPSHAKRKKRQLAKALQRRAEMTSVQEGGCGDADISIVDADGLQA